MNQRGTGRPLNRGVGFLLTAFSLLQQAGPVAAAGGGNLFASGDIVLDSPAGSLVIVIVLIIMSIALERGIHSLQHGLHNQHSKMVLAHVLTELMLLGIISMLLAFGGELVRIYADLTIVHWAHMVIFMMAAFFIGLNSAFIALVKRNWARWVVLEQSFELFEQNPQRFQRDLELITKKQSDLAFFVIYHRFRQQVLHLNTNYKHIKFCRYLKKCQRATMLHLIELHWKSWVCLVLLSGVNSFRYVLSDLFKFDHFSNTLVFVLLLGIPPLVLFFIVKLKIGLSYRHLTLRDIENIDPSTLTPEKLVEVASVPMMPVNGDIEAYLKDKNRHLPAIHAKITKEADPATGLINHNAYFFFNSPHATLLLIQMSSILVVFYLALVLTNIYEIYTTGLYLLAPVVVPPTLYFFLCPGVLRRYTMLSATGNLLQKDVLADIASKDEGDDDDDGHASHNEHDNNRKALIHLGTLRKERLREARDANIMGKLADRLVLTRYYQKWMQWAQLRKAGADLSHHGLLTVTPPLRLQQRAVATATVETQTEACCFVSSAHLPDCPNRRADLRQRRVSISLADNDFIEPVDHSSPTRNSTESIQELSRAAPAQNVTFSAPPAPVVPLPTSAAVAFAHPSAQPNLATVPVTAQAMRARADSIAVHPYPTATDGTQGLFVSPPGSSVGGSYRSPPRSLPAFTVPEMPRPAVAWSPVSSGAVPSVPAPRRRSRRESNGANPLSEPLLQNDYQAFKNDSPRTEGSGTVVHKDNGNKHGQQAFVFPPPISHTSAFSPLRPHGVSTTTPVGSYNVIRKERSSRESVGYPTSQPANSSGKHRHHTHHRLASDREDSPHTPRSHAHNSPPKAPLTINSVPVSGRNRSNTNTSTWRELMITDDQVPAGGSQALEYKMLLTSLQRQAVL
eukprot:TRINITY_DN43588_c0_g1_i1.p1 TRINITY_DN43588_c0_g1~~TRINITY_DN43588_c0_g1_i1.p1  ORF type:complete len:907 (+),score=102.99 TRINITY_DN43588_c0_g1_i1:53-2773(+)